MTAANDSTLNDEMTIVHNGGSDAGDSVASNVYTYKGTAIDTRTFTIKGNGYIHAVKVYQGGKSFNPSTETIDATELKMFAISAESADTSIATVDVATDGSVTIISVAEGSTTVTAKDADENEIVITVTVSADGTLLAEYEPLEHTATISVNDIDEAKERSTSITAVSVDQDETVIQAELEQDSNKVNQVKITSVSEGTATVSITMANRDVAKIPVEVDEIGEITVDLSNYDYIYQDVKTLSLNELYSSVDNSRSIESVESLSTNVVTVATTKKPESSLSANAIVFTSQNEGTTNVVATLDNGDVMTIAITVGSDGLIEDIDDGDVEYTAAADVAVMPTITVSPSGKTTYKDSSDSFYATGSNTDGGTLTYQWYINTTDDTTSGTLIAGATESTYTREMDECDQFYLYCKDTNTRNNTSKTAVSETIKVTVRDCYTLTCDDLGFTSIPTSIEPSGTTTDIIVSADGSGSTPDAWKWTLIAEYGVSTENAIVYTFTDEDSCVATATVTVTNGIISVEIEEFVAQTISMNRLNTSVEYSETGNTLSNNSASESFVYLPVALTDTANVSITAEVTYTTGSYAGVGFVSVDEDGNLGGYAVATNNKIKYRKTGASLNGAGFDSGSGVSGACTATMKAICSNGTLSFEVYDSNGDSVGTKGWNATYHVSDGETNYLALGGSYANCATFSKIKVIQDGVTYKVDQFVDPNAATTVDYTANFLAISDGTAYSSDTGITTDGEETFDTALVLYSPSNRLKIRKNTNYVNYNGGTKAAFATTTIGDTLSETLDRYVAVDISKLTESGTITVKFSGIVKASTNGGDTGEVVLVDQDNKILASSTGLKLLSGSDTFELTAHIDASSVSKVKLGFSRGGSGGGGIDVQSVTAKTAE